MSAALVVALPRRTAWLATTTSSTNRVILPISYVIMLVTVAVAYGWL